MNRESLAQRQQNGYQALIADPHAPFVRERPALFSPAAAAQDAGNVRSTFGAFGPFFLPLEYTNGWVAESCAHVFTCYLGDWSSLAKIRIEGPQALEFLTWLGMNDLSNFEFGQVKHHIQLDENGFVASEGIVCRLAEEQFLYTAGSGDWLLSQFGEGKWDAEVVEISPARFIFGVQGPESIHVVEAAVAESVRDIAFNRSRPATIAGHSVRVLRTGISGELGYEVHGEADDADAVWTAILEAGEGHGIQQLGFRCQSLQHVEAGIATNGLDYMAAAAMKIGPPRQFRSGKITGSFVPTQFPDYFRRPDELGWGNRGQSPKHEFLGRDALIAARQDRQRRFVGLRWDNADVVAIFASLFEGDTVEQMDLPRRQGPAFDRVLSPGGEDIGVSTGRALSPSLKTTISLCVIDPELAVPGTSVAVLWGSPGTSQREVRATVTELPFKPDNRRTDLATIPTSTPIAT